MDQLPIVNVSEKDCQRNFNCMPSNLRHALPEYPNSTYMLAKIRKVAFI